MSKRRFLFAMWEGGGNVTPMLGAARRLVERGHRVRVIGDPTIQEEAEHVGCGFTPWRRAPHRVDLRPENDLLRDWETTNPISMMRRYRDLFIVAPAAAYAADTLEALEQEPADVVVPEYTMFGAIMAAEKARIPTAALVPNIWPLPAPGAPPFGPGFLPAKTALDRLRDRVVSALSSRMFDGALPELNRVRASLGLSPLGGFFEQALRADALLVLSSAAFDFASPFVPSNTRYVGPVLDDPQWARSWTPPWDPSNHAPIVLVGFSTTFQDQAAMLQRIVDGLARLPVRGLVTLGEMLSDGAVQPKGAVAVVRSAPHREVLSKAALVITHCGHGTTLKALVAGVPLVCVPMGRDQNDNAARVVHAGAGVRLSPKASAEAVADAARRVLADESYRTAARALGRAIADESARTDVATALEGVALGASVVSRKGSG